MTVRELIQMMLLNCSLDDRVVVEYKRSTEIDHNWIYNSEDPKRVFHMGNGESVIECHDD